MPERDGSSEITSLLRRLNDGQEVGDELFALLYRELHSLARRNMRGQGVGHTLQASALVNEAWLRIEGAWSFESRTHFLAVASKAMRHVLVDHARAAKAQKREAGERLPIDSIVLEVEESAIDLEGLNRALEKMGEFNPEMAQAIELRFFGGASAKEAARVAGVPQRTFERRWRAARVWLRAELAR